MADRDIAQPLYGAIDWSRSVIGGSYALQQFTQDNAWTPNDIDIPYACDTHEEFIRERDRFQAALGGPGVAQVLRTNLWTPALRAEAVLRALRPLAAGGGHDYLSREEGYHEAIVASARLVVRNIPLQVQLVGMTTSPMNSFPQDSLLRRLARITDLPACVSYSAFTGTRIFHIPEHGMDAILTRRIRNDKICASRKEKYLTRGYTFYE